MHRPCFLVIDREFAGSISTRKLVIETAKFNVVTAYSATEAVELLRRFPNVDGAVVDVGVNDISCDHLVEQLKEIRPGLPVIAISGPRHPDCEQADYNLESFAPGPLLAILRELQSAECDAIEENEEKLHAEGK
jgi:DNA-binding NtrC family response regulator